MGMHRLGACRSEVVFKNDGQPWYLGQLHVCWNSGPYNYGILWLFLCPLITGTALPSRKMQRNPKFPSFSCRIVPWYHERCIQKWWVEFNSYWWIDVRPKLGHLPKSCPSLVFAGLGHILWLVKFEWGFLNKGCNPRNENSTIRVHFFSQFEWGSSILIILDRVDFQVRFGIWSALPMATLLEANQWESGGETSGAGDRSRAMVSISPNQLLSGVILQVKSLLTIILR